MEVTARHRRGLLLVQGAAWHTLFGRRDSCYMGYGMLRGGGVLVGMGFGPEYRIYRIYSNGQLITIFCSGHADQYASCHKPILDLALCEQAASRREGAEAAAEESASSVKYYGALRRRLYTALRTGLGKKI